MAFGQQPGPPATARQVAELLELLQNAGHLDFRDARGPMGFNQRQAAGRFTRDEAAALISQLRDEAEGTEMGGGASAADPPAPAGTARRSRTELALARISDSDLAAELQRRGWIVVEP